jgi:hypothetical protein
MGNKKRPFPRIIIRNYTGEIQACEFMCEVIRRFWEEKSLKDDEVKK